MTTDTTTDDNASPRNRLARRDFLGLLGAVAATGRASAQTDGDVAVGGGGADHDFRYGAVSTAPSTISPGFDKGAWAQRDTGTLRAGYTGSLPVTFDAGGVTWSLASDLATAESNAGSGPAVAIGSNGSIDIGYDGSLPQTHSADGVTVAIAADVATAKSQVSTPPAIAAGSDGVEVAIDV